MSNSWWEIKIDCVPDLEENIFWRLSEFGCKGMSTQKQGKEITISAYIPQTQVKLLEISDLSLQLEDDANEIGSPLPVTKCNLIDEEDWSSSWKQHWQPQPIGDRLLINPAWLEVPTDPDRTILQLDPGVAFGTGTHATTQLCLEALEMRLQPGNGLTIADIGCGSGILSTAAFLLGAKQIYAVDNDPLAVKATGENRDLNGIPAANLIVELGSIDRLQAMLPEPVDGFVCNILADVIVQLAPSMSALVKPKGWAILSGILSSQVADVSHVLEQHGWTVGTVWNRLEWSCINLKYK
ncbi:50S ribosomal protein L11 methyltransferase [Chamaesiphon polymorphus]|uniref:Ribosomal protein L11 methyltransferase n=1 Tax=Chamaesiphon polymorphus CCALA 037 TaxID=2107692 RepID=A0A2T1FHS6_9CYAN|nr:50S ribosomal protein L11 methyltransferase [Chamaesiphon polymorphus]PSB44514.1 50S ribosomal protein L11 methyltransferase [Chamaesiphon polymorphus CCALA 037]